MVPEVKGDDTRISLSFNTFPVGVVGEEMDIDIRYGDFIGYHESEDKIRYYTVVNDGKVTSDNKHNMFGFRPHYRTITCAIAQESEFRGI